MQIKLILYKNQNAKKDFFLIICYWPLKEDEGK